MSILLKVYSTAETATPGRAKINSKTPSPPSPRPDAYQLSVLLISNPTLETLFPHPCSGELRTQKLKSHLMRRQSLHVLPLKPGVRQYIVMHATLIARDFFLANFFPSCPFTCIFSKTSPEFFLRWLWLTLVPV